jgi:hypothetical protein
MNYRYLSTILAASLAAVSMSASAETIFRPRVSLGYSNYEFAIPSNNFTIDTNYLKGGVGATIATGRLYFDLGYSGSIDAEYNDGTLPQDEEFLRKDLTLTVGYVIGNNITIFGGYKSGSSEFSNVDVGISKTKFEASGPYVGAGIGFPVGKGTLSVNGAVAFQDADLTDNDTVGTPLNATGDTLGLSIGAAYNMPFSREQGIAFKANYQDYDYSDWQDPNYTISDITETIFFVDAEYYYNF